MRSLLFVSCLVFHVYSVIRIHFQCPQTLLPGNRKVAESAEQLARERELAKVAINKEDVDLILNELEISKTKAERTLREHQGNVVEALAALTN